MRIDLANRLAQPGAIDLDAYVRPSEATRKLRVCLGEWPRGAVPELLDQVAVADCVEQARVRRVGNGLEVTRVQRVDVPLAVAGKVAPVVEAPAIEKVHAA